MALSGLIGWWVGLCMLQACTPAPSPTPATAAAPAKPAAFVFGTAPTGAFVSKRFGLELHLPDGRAWRIDDHSDAFLVATHAAAASTLRAMRFEPLAGQNPTHDSCWESAVARGVFTERGNESPLEDAASYDGSLDTRVLITLSGRGDDGHVRWVAADRADCIAVGVDAKRLAGDTDETLAGRLAVLRERVLGSLVPKPAALPRAPR